MDHIDELIKTLSLYTISDKNESYIATIIDFLEKVHKVISKTSSNYVNAAEVIKIVSTARTERSELYTQYVRKEEVFYILQKNKIFIMTEDRVKAVFDYVVNLYVNYDESMTKSTIAKLLYRLKTYIVTFLQSSEINKHNIVYHIKEFIIDILCREKKTTFAHRKEKDFTDYVMFLTLELFLQYCHIIQLNDIITEKVIELNDKTVKILDGTLDITDVEFSELLHRFTMILKNLPSGTLERLKLCYYNSISKYVAALAQNLMKLEPEGPLMKYEIDLIVYKLVTN